MTQQEFSEQFDILYNNVTSNQAPGLDEYEKSTFLTLAQDEILKAYLNPKGNKFLEGYGDSSLRDIDFSTLITIKRYSPIPMVHLKEGKIEQGNAPLSKARYDIHDNSASAKLPDDIFVILDEQMIVKRDNKNILLQVLPINYMEYNRIMSKPYKRPLHYQAWRLFNGGEQASQVDIVVGAGDIIESYVLRYIRKPAPIILKDSYSISIDGIQAGEDSPCELDSNLHYDILCRAVELAKAAYTGDLTAMLTLGQMSHTNMGIVSQGKSE